MSGRTYNDITQYPVFPWVIADYESETLDFNDPKTFRDLSKPVGALNEKRLERFEERYDAFDDPDIPKFHYGSHYSSAGIVLFYLRCLEPFTTLSRQLAGNKFDHADRLFHDIPTAWKGVNSDMSDVKELIPEFFYLPEMFQNVNKVDFGKTQTGEALGDVKLPKWASSPFDFVAKKPRRARERTRQQHPPTCGSISCSGVNSEEMLRRRPRTFFTTSRTKGTWTWSRSRTRFCCRRRAIRLQTLGRRRRGSRRVRTRRVCPRTKRSAARTGYSRTLRPRASTPISIPVASGGGVPLVKVAATPGRIVAVTADLNALTHKFSPNTPDNASLPFTFQPARESGAFAGFMRAFGRAGGKTSSASVGGDSARGPAPLRATLDPALAATLKDAKKRASAGGVRDIDAAAVTETPLGATTFPCEVTPDGKYILTGGHVDGGVKVYRSDVAGAPVAAREMRRARGTRHRARALQRRPRFNHRVRGLVHRGVDVTKRRIRRV